MKSKQIITSYRQEFHSSELANFAVLYLLANNKVICMALFTAEDYLPPPREGMNGIIYIAYRCDWLYRIVNVLEQENPVYFIWDEERKIAQITNGIDIVGEEQNKSLFRFVFGDESNERFE